MMVFRREKRKKKRSPATLSDARIEPRNLDELTVRLRGAGLEARRRLRPLTGAIGAGWSRVESALEPIAPVITRALFYVVLVPVRLIVLLLNGAQAVLGWTGARAAAAAAFLEQKVTPLGAVAVVAAAAAIALAASQFVDYRGVAVGAPLYEGEVGTVAGAPLTDLETTGSAHAYVMVPLAVLALALIAVAATRNWRYGRAVAVIGLVGIAITLLVDLPQGLDAGRSGLAYSGGDAELMEGFWAQLAACATLVLCGLLLSAYAREAKVGGERRAERARRLPWRRGAGSASPEPGT